MTNWVRTWNEYIQSNEIKQQYIMYHLVHTSLVSARFSQLPTIATQLSYAQLVVATLYYTTLCKEGGGGDY